jgi:hypothetical protein
MTYAKITGFEKQNWWSIWQSMLLKWALLAGEQKVRNLWETERPNKKQIVIDVV